MKDVEDLDGALRGVRDVDDLGGEGVPEGAPSPGSVRRGGAGR
ncbi:unnamed protein product [[Actinomadura] parvosata subsp. kistnae]|nr:unnamed protein product [Actinomadura parvosata subsp. kistnae]